MKIDVWDILPRSKYTIICTLSVNDDIIAQLYGYNGKNIHFYPEHLSTEVERLASEAEELLEPAIKANDIHLALNTIVQSKYGIEVTSTKEQKQEFLLYNKLGKKKYKEYMYLSQEL